jgi:cell filamentation protein
LRPKDHPYCYPGTDIYRNKEGIRDNKDLEDFESRQSASRLMTLPHDLPITVQGYREIHRYVFQDVYDWAGQYRTVNTGRTGPFCKAEYIASELSKRFAAINVENNLRGLTADRFATRSAEHMNELNAIHPFLDGNGRTQRAFLEILARQAGHKIDLARIDPKVWNEASKEGYYTQDHRRMRDVIAGALIEAERGATEAKSAKVIDEREEERAERNERAGTPNADANDESQPDRTNNPDSHRGRRR